MEEELMGRSKRARVSADTHSDPIAEKIRRIGAGAPALTPEQSALIRRLTRHVALADIGEATRPRRPDPLSRTAPRKPLDPPSLAG